MHELAALSLPLAFEPMRIGIGASFDPDENATVADGCFVILDAMVGYTPVLECADQAACESDSAGCRQCDSDWADE